MAALRTLTRRLKPHLLAALVMMPPPDACAQFSPAEPPGMMDLPATARFHEGDDPAWAHPALDDSGWREVALPGILPAQGQLFDGPVGWYRLRLPAVRVPEGVTLMLHMDGVAGAAEAWLNGRPLRVRVGGGHRASFGVADVERPVFPPSRALFLLSTRRSDWQEEGHENMLALRIVRAPRAGGIEPGRARLGLLVAMMSRLEPEQRALLALENGALAACVLGLVTALLMGLGDRREGWHWCNAALFAATGASLLLEGHLAFLMGWSTHGLTRLGWAVTLAVPVAVLRSLEWPGRRALSLMMAGVCAVLAAALLTARDIRVLEGCHRGMTLCLGAGAVVGVWQSLRALRRDEGGVAAFGIAASLLLAVWCLHLLGLQLGLPDLVPPGHLRAAVMLLVAGFYLVLVLRLHLARNKYRRLLRASLTAQEDERRRLARDLHDGVGQALQALKLRLQINRQMEGADQVDECIQELRSAASALRPVYLGRMPLAGALQTHAEHFAQNTGVEIEFESNLDQPVPPAAEEHLFRILQEALTNAARHGGATRVRVSLMRRNGSLRLSVSDDGAGCAKKKHPPGSTSGGGHGLHNIRERAALLGGRMRFDPLHPGSRLEVIMPLPDKTP